MLKHSIGRTLTSNTSTSKYRGPCSMLEVASRARVLNRHMFPTLEETVPYMFQCVPFLPSSLFTLHLSRGLKADGLDPHLKASKSARADVLADWLVATFGGAGALKAGESTHHDCTTLTRGRCAVALARRVCWFAMISALWGDFKRPCCARGRVGVRVFDMYVRMCNNMLFLPFAVAWGRLGRAGRGGRRRGPGDAAGPAPRRPSHHHRPARAKAQQAPAASPAEGRGRGGGSGRGGRSRGDGGRGCGGVGGDGGSVGRCSCSRRGSRVGTARGGVLQRGVRAGGAQGTP